MADKLFRLSYVGYLGKTVIKFWLEGKIFLLWINLFDILFLFFIAFFGELLFVKYGGLNIVERGGSI